MPLRVALLTAPLDVVLDRLGAEPTGGRAADAARTATWAGRGTGPDHVPADLVVVNDRSVAEVADEVLARLGWRG